MDRVELLLVVLNERADGAPKWESGEERSYFVVVLLGRDAGEGEEEGLTSASTALKKVEGNSR